MPFLRCVRRLRHRAPRLHHHGRRHRPRQGHRPGRAVLPRIRHAHTAAPGTGSSCLAAAASIPGTVPSSILAAGNLKAGKGGTVTFGHPSGTFSLTAEPVLAASPNDISFAKVAYPRTARIISDGTVYVKNERPPEATAWKEADEITANLSSSKPTT